MDRNGAGKPDVTLYTTEPCARCLRAKQLLEAQGVEYREINLVRDPGGRRELVALTGRTTFPQVVVDGRPLGGFDELAEADSRGELRALASRGSGSRAATPVRRP